MSDHDLALPEPSGARTPRTIDDRPSRVDRVFDRVTLVSGLAVLLLLTLIGLFLFIRSQDAFRVTGLWHFLTREGWRTDVKPARIGVAGLLCGTIIVAAIAIVIAVPLGVIAALFITDYSNARSRRYLTALVDLLAAVPSLLYGIWGFLVPVERDRAPVEVAVQAPGLDPDLQDRPRTPASPGRCSSPGSSSR